MAAPHTLPNTPLLNRYSDEAAIEDRAYSLPGGGCNWTNLSLGANAPKCGCRRFWEKSPSGTGVQNGERSGFCMCEHHACYHDFGSQERGLGEIGNEDLTRLLAARKTPQTPGQSRTPDEALYLEGAQHDEDLPDTIQWSRYIHNGSQGLPPIPSQCLLPSDNGSMTSGSQTAYHRPFGGLGLGTLEHTPRSNQIVAETARLQAEGTRNQVYEDANGNAYFQSLTDLATPSVRATQDQATNFGRHYTSVHNALQTVAEARSSQSGASRTALKDDGSQVLVRSSRVDPVTAVKLDQGTVIPYRQDLLQKMADIPEKVANHEHRIDLLENASFSNAGIEDLQEADDQMDTRVGELEGRVEELERVQAIQNDASSVSSRRNLEGSFDSKASDTSAMIGPALGHIDPSRFEALEAQVAELRAVAPPSHAHPWEVEVVFLPFGIQLMGIWSPKSTMSQRSRGGSTALEDWTQSEHKSMALAQASFNNHGRNPTWEQSAMDLGDADSAWLMAKACGLRSRVDERLRSRGLVRTIQICGPDARDVQSAMMAAFEELPGILCEDPFGSQHENVGTIPRSLRSYIGLQASWIPLRKQHKDPCLRFLHPSEMITPALWTVPFLSSSVAMRQSGTRRLYVTQRDSYIQHLATDNANWTWQKLRQLPRVYSDQRSFSHTPEADAQEACWTFDSRLDPPPSTHSSLHSSFASNISSLSICSTPNSPEVRDVLELEPTSPSDHFSSAAASPTTSTPRTSIAAAPPPSPLRERAPFPSFHARSSSMPSLLTLRASSSSSHYTTSSKRRIASFDLEPSSSPTRAASTSTQNGRPLEYKKRRISRSPSRPRDTPRWSVGPPSPYPILEDADRKRGTTPFAYATPHSNAPYVPRSGGVEVYEDAEDDDEQGSTTDDFNIHDDNDEEDDECYDQNALSDYDGSGDQNPEENWQSTSGEAALGPEADDGASDASSSPSEYPSTQQRQESTVAKPATALFERRQETELGFVIHIDDEVDDERV